MFCNCEGPSMIYIIYIIYLYFFIGCISVGVDLCCSVYNLVNYMWIWWTQRSSTQLVYTVSTFMSVQMSFLSMEEHVEGDPCKFMLVSRGSSERLTLQAANVEIKLEWVRSIRALLNIHSNFLEGEKPVLAHFVGQ